MLNIKNTIASDLFILADLHKSTDIKEQVVYGWTEIEEKN